LPDQTPNLHLSLGQDAAENANWQKIDALLGTMAVATIIPGNLQVQGDLDVTGNASIAGILTAGQLQAPTGAITSLQTSDLNVGHSIILPAGSLNPAALPPAATVQGAWVGTPGNGTITTTITTQQQLCTCATDATEEPTRWDLVFANVSFQVGLNTDPGTAQNIAWNVGLYRGDPPGQLQQTRNLAYTLTKAGFFYIPLTIVRVAKPPAPVGAARWDLAVAMTTTNATVSLTWAFGQIQVLQLR